ncbi:diguanylate cyclase domain-containing protein [Methylobacterium sp. C33D]
MSRARADDESDGRPTLSLWVTAASLYFCTAASTLCLVSSGRDIAAIWPANAILVALLLCNDRSRSATVLSAGLAANVAANVLARGTLVGPLLYSVANLAEVTLAVHLLRKTYARDALLQSTGSALRFLAIAGLLAPAASGVLGSATAYLVFGEPPLRAFGTWVASDGLGLIVFTPFLLSLFRGDYATALAKKRWRERLEAVALLALAGSVAYATFFCTSRPLLFLIFPPLILIAFRLGRLGVTAAVMVVAVIGGLATIYGRGPMVLIAADAVTQAQAFQVFLAFILLTCLPVAAEVSARARLTAALAAHDREMTRSAFTDSLTGLLNRAGFEHEIATILPVRALPPASLIAIDVDHFKQINDHWGHQAGDRALRTLGSLLASQIRPGDLVARLGGDEFVILLRGSDLERARAVCERIRAGARGLPDSTGAGSEAPLSVSMGLAVARVGEGYEQLAQRADRALYEAKDAGRNALRWAA